MADLDNLMALNGAVAAFKFSSKGELQESRTIEADKFTDTVLDLVSHVCVANMAISTMQARGWEHDRHGRLLSRERLHPGGI